MSFRDTKVNMLYNCDVPHRSSREKYWASIYRFRRSLAKLPFPRAGTFSRRSRANGIHEYITHL